MLTKRQNFLETIHGGNPDRFVNQYEPFAFLFGGPVTRASKIPLRGETVKNAWGVTIQFPEHVPGPFPLHDEEHILVKDVATWRDVVKAPKVDYPDEDWADIRDMADAIDRNEQFVTLLMAPGVFEQLHYLMGMVDCLMSFYTEPNAIKELIDYITEYELAYSERLLKHTRADALLHHDDWGSQLSSFLSPEMFKEFIVPAYKKIYGFHKANGVKIIVHHSDSYAANLVPHMIEMGIDVFQGCLTSNNVPELVKKYGGQISFMGDINNGVVDKEGWTQEHIDQEVERACRTCGKRYFIPCLATGGPGSVYPGVYQAVSEAVNKMNRLMF